MHKIMRNQEDPLQLFKREIEAKCQQTFTQLRNKNQITKTLLANLNQGVNRQARRIENLGNNIANLQSLGTSSNTQTEVQREVQTLIQEKDNQINQAVNQILSRLQSFEDTVRGIPRLETQPRRLKQLDDSLSEIQQQIEALSSFSPQQASLDPNFHYEEQKKALEGEIGVLEKLLEQEKLDFGQTNKELEKNLEIYRASIQQPITTFQVNLTRQNQENQKILKARLNSYAAKIKAIQNTLQTTANQLQDRRRAAFEGQRKIEEGLANININMVQVQSDLASLENKRSNRLQEAGNQLDALVQRMLVETAQLTERIDNLKLKYQEQTKRIRAQVIQNQNSLRNFNM